MYVSMYNVAGLDSRLVEIMLIQSGSELERPDATWY